MLLFDVSLLKEKIKGSAATCCQELYRFMPEYVYETAKKFTQKLSAMHQTISILPTTVDQFVTYMENVNSISSKLEDISNVSQEVTAMSLLIEELKIKLSERYR